MIYSIGDEIKFSRLKWQSDWDSKEIFGEDYPNDFVIGLYSEPCYSGDFVSYYIDLRNRKVIAIFIENDEENVETIWDEGYIV